MLNQNSHMLVAMGYACSNGIIVYLLLLDPCALVSLSLCLIRKGLDYYWGLLSASNLQTNHIIEILEIYKNATFGDTFYKIVIHF